MDNRRGMSRFTFLLLTATAALAIGCGDSGGRPTDGGGTDADDDSGSGTDGGGGDDAGGGGMDGGMDAAVDGSAADAATDAGTDATPIDASGLVADGGILSCVGEDLPSAASDPLAVGGSVQEISIDGMTPVNDALLEVFEDPDAPSLVASTRSSADGTFSVSVDNPDEAPLDAYLRATADGYKITYLFPPYPLREDFGNALVGMVTEGTYNLLLFGSGADHTEGNGVAAVLVVDCFGDPVEGATVSSDPPAGDIGYSGSEGAPTVERSRTADDGLAYLFDLPPGDVEVDARVGGVSMREHRIKVFGDRVTTTLVLP